jgi:hypothetical protein
MRQRFSTSSRSSRSDSGNRNRSSRSRTSSVAVVERLEDRTLLSNSYTLTNGNLFDNGVLVSPNVIQFSVGRGGDAYYINPTNISTSENWLYINTGPSPSDDTLLATVYKYGVVTNNVLPPRVINPFNGDAYYWNVADGRLYVNTSNTSSIAISTDSIRDFAIHGNASSITDDSAVDWWDSNGSLMANTPTSSDPTLVVEVDSNIKGMGLRNDGEIYVWDTTTSALRVDGVTITTDALGFGMRGDGNAFYWDATQGGDLFLNTPGATYNISSGPIQSFASDGYNIDANAFNSSINGSTYYIGGTGYFSTSGTDNFYKATVTVATALVLNNLSNPTTLNSLWRVSSLDPGAGATVWVQTTTGNGSYVYEPLYGVPTVNNGGGPELTSSTVKEYVIYWGTQWPAPAGSPSQSTINTGISTLFSSDYLKSLTQYNGSITGNATMAGSWMDSTDVLTTNFSDAQLQTVVSRAISTNGWPTTTVAAAANSAIYMVITLPGFVSADSADAGGFHKSFVSGSNEIVYGWTGNDGVLGDMLTTLSHETVEAITNPLVNVNNGIFETAAPAIDTLLSTLGFSGFNGELADFEPNLLGYAKSFVRAGVTVTAQAYWSTALQSYIIET